jgi:hypothetical protein
MPGTKPAPTPRVPRSRGLAPGKQSYIKRSAPTPRHKVTQKYLLDDAVVNSLVRASPGPLTDQKIQAAATLTGYGIGTMKLMIERAREKFARAAEKYVDTHLHATERALETGDYETATKASQWAMSNLAAEGVRVIDRPEEGSGQGPKVLIGIKLGGLGPDTRAAAP